MTAVTAKVAGVKRIVVASPKPTPETFAAALVAGVDELIAVGGPQTIGALTYGVGTLEGVDVIVGPGNKYVTAAKKYVSGHVGIDMLAGPSELVVVADDNADPDIVAADLIAQAEHDPDARPILIAFSNNTVARVRECILAQLSTLDTAAIASAALTDHGRAYLATDRDDAVRLCNAIAPEHLELLVDDADAMADELRNYGGLFIGRGAAEVLGDYGAGPNHVLPTGGTARFSSGLSVYDFLKTPTFIGGTASPPLIDDVKRLAEIERLFGHQRSAERRT
jgi:phosphoribosyl-ATP pyrophosphohydrolase/phosphoribosyl-AMP cyclohydrolase/histidinol dehydrogenase